MPNNTPVTRQEIESFMRGTALYTQGAAVSVFFMATIFDTCLRILPNLSIGFYRNDELTAVFDRNAMVSAAQRLLDSIAGRQSEIKSLWREWRQHQEYADQYCAELRRGDLSVLSKEALQAELVQYQKVVDLLWQKAFFIDCFDPTGHALLDSLVYAHHPTLTEAEKSLAVQHQQLTSSMLLERDILKGLTEGADGLAAQLQRDYHWMTNDYTHGVYLPVEHFEQAIADLKKQYPTQTQHNERLHTIERYSEHVQEQKEQLFSRHQFTEREQGIAIAFADLTDWREERKRQMQNGAWTFQQFIDALSARYGLEPELLRLHDPRQQALLDSPDGRAVLEHRKQYGVLQVSDGVTHTSRFVDDPDLIDVYQHEKSNVFGGNDSRFSGQIGMKGVVRGRVKIIYGTKDFAKFTDGDILVSPMTRPELMPVIRRAAGIITDEGGITCHAALVARELKIPCVIGTQIATQILHDDDQVELNADTGTITKL